MKRKPFLYSGRNDGISIIEILIAISIFALVLLSATFVFRTTLLRTSRLSAEKIMSQKAYNLFSFLRAHLPEAVVRDIEGNYRLDFIGSAGWVRFIAPLSEGDGSDLGQFGCALINGAVKISFVRLNADMSSYSFPDGFAGAQTLVDNVRSFSLSYWDGNQWSNFWDTREEPHKGKLPLVVKVSVIFDRSIVEGKEICSEFIDEIPVEQ